MNNDSIETTVLKENEREADLKMGYPVLRPLEDYEVDGQRV